MKGCAPGVVPGAQPFRDLTRHRRQPITTGPLLTILPWVSSADSTRQTPDGSLAQAKRHPPTGLGIDGVNDRSPGESRCLLCIVRPLDQLLILRNAPVPTILRTYRKVPSCYAIDGRGHEPKPIR